MARTHQGTTGTGKERKAGARVGVASGLLHEDHQRVQAMFKEYETASRSGESARKQELAGKICTELKVHTQIEEELFYPSLRDAGEQTALIDEAVVEHASAKQLIKEIEDMQPDDRLFDAKVKVLGEYVRHHIREEEEQMFPQARQAGIDTAEMARQLKERKHELKTQVH